MHPEASTLSSRLPKSPLHLGPWTRVSEGSDSAAMNVDESASGANSRRAPQQLLGTRPAEGELHQDSFLTTQSVEARREKHTAPAANTSSPAENHASSELEMHVLCVDACLPPRDNFVCIPDATLAQRTVLTTLTTAVRTHQMPRFHGWRCSRSSWHQRAAMADEAHPNYRLHRRCIEVIEA